MCRLTDKWRIALIHQDYEPLQEREVLVLIVSAWLQRRAGRWKDSATETKIKTIKEILKM